MRDGEKGRYALRSARPEEVDEVFSLYEKRVRWMDEKGIRQWNDTDYLNAYPADERWAESEDEPAFYVHNLVTDSSAPGAGRALLAAAEALGQAHGKRYMRLDCAVDSAFLNGYYEAMGYRAVGQCEDGPYVGVKRQKEL